MWNEVTGPDNLTGERYCYDGYFETLNGTKEELGHNGKFYLTRKSGHTMDVLGTNSTGKEDLCNLGGQRERPWSTPWVQSEWSEIENGSGKNGLMTSKREVLSSTEFSFL